MSAGKTRNLVLLLSDMKGYTARTSRQTRVENERMLALHDALLLPVVRGFAGTKLKGIGDAVLAGFDSPTDAVLCAMAVQDRLAAYNAGAAAGEAIEVRISLSQGEVRVDRKDVNGEPVLLAIEAGARADAGDVVLTDAVYLSMNKSEVPTEVLGDQPVRGGGSVRLRRALRSGPRVAPYGGRALRALGKLPDPARALAVRKAVDAGLAFVRRRAAWALALLVVAGAAAGERARAASPLSRATSLLASRQPVAALAELDKLAASPEGQSPAVALVRGKAEQQLGQLGLAFADLVLVQQAGVLDEAGLRALADDLDSESFPKAYRPALIATLGEQIGAAAAPAVRRLLDSPRAATRRDATEVLERAGAMRDEDRLLAAHADLADALTPCPTRLAAIRRLELLPAASGQADLRRAAGARVCGAREASDALRRLSRLAVR